VKKIIIPSFLILIAILTWQYRVNIVVWSIPRVLNIIRPVLSEGTSNWQKGPTVKDFKEQRPNIILILADDLGFNDISLYNGGAGSGLLMTPNIDKIAKDR